MTSARGSIAWLLVLLACRPDGRTKAPPEVCIHRVANRRGDVSDADAGVVRAQFARETGAISWVRLDASGGARGTAQSALELLGAESR